MLKNCLNVYSGGRMEVKSKSKPAFNPEKKNVAHDFVLVISSFRYSFLCCPACLTRPMVSIHGPSANMNIV